MRIHLDDRRFAACDIFKNLTETSEIDLSVIYPGTAILWHSHQLQYDEQIVIKGSLKIGLCNFPEIYNEEILPSNFSKDDIFAKRQKIKDEWIRNCKYTYKTTLSETEPEVKWHVLSEYNMSEGPLFICQFVWHGCYNFTNKPAYLLYHISQKFNPNDEQRCDWKLMGYDYKRNIK